MDLLKGLSLFSGIGGIDIALRDWVKPVVYCEIDPYCQSVLLQRMQEGHLPKAPIWDDIRSLCSGNIQPLVDIIYGGFPCQDISIAGLGKGLAGERSGLFFEIMRLAYEIKPTFIFLENVPAIATRGGLQVVSEIASLGYDCRWCVISAASVGALHRRERWFLLAYSKHYGVLTSQDWGSLGERTSSWKEQEEPTESIGSTERASGLSRDVANAKCQRLEGQWKGTISPESEKPLSSSAGNDGNADSIPASQTHSGTVPQLEKRNTRGNDRSEYWPFESRADWKKTCNSICRVSDGVPNRVERLKALGNAVVPIQVRKAFKILSGCA